MGARTSESRKGKRRPISREIVERFLAGEGIHALTLSFRGSDEWWGQNERRIEDILRRALRKGMKP